MKAPATRLAVIVLSSSLVLAMAVTSRAADSSGSGSSSGQAAPMGGCCGPTQPSAAPGQ
jgi:hypothetical protein